MPTTAQIQDRSIISFPSKLVAWNRETEEPSCAFDAWSRRGGPVSCLFIGFCLVTCAGCDSKTQRLQTLAIVVSGDTAGWIVPCGCALNQSGGLARRGTFIRSLHTSGAVLVADVGGAAAGNSPYDCAKFEAILAGELRMGLAAHNIGLSEAKLGAEYLRTVSRQLRVPFISCNVSNDRGELIADSHRITAIAGRRVAFLGVLTDAHAIPGLKIETPKAAVLNLLPKLKGQFDHLIVLAYLPELELRSLASVLPEADIVIGGPTGQCIVPEKTGSRWIASATNKGKFVCSFTAHEDSPTWTAAIHELSDSIEDDHDQTQNVQTFHELLAKRDFTAQQTAFVPPDTRYATKDISVVGSDRCFDCHAFASEIWKHSKHASAWESLTKSGSHVDSYCQQCHSMSFGMPGGFESVTSSPQRVSVGCEDCHGAGSAHVAEPTLRTPTYGQTQFRCDRCHDRENSPKFTYESYWPRIAHEGTKK